MNINDNNYVKKIVLDVFNLKLVMMVKDIFCISMK